MILTIHISIYSHFILLKQMSKQIVFANKFGAMRKSAENEGL